MMGFEAIITVLSSRAHPSAGQREVTGGFRPLSH